MILLKSNPNTLNIVSKALLENKVVIIPTDTVYGFSGIVPHSDSIIRAIKGRDEVKPFIQLIAHPDEIKKYSNTIIPNKIAKHMPGPLTIIVKNIYGDSTTAFRCPNDEWLLELIQRCKVPLYSTSTNRSGKAILFDVNQMKKEFGNEVFCIVDGALSESESTKPSTIVDISKGDITIVRQGAVVI